MPDFGQGLANLGAGIGEGIQRRAERRRQEEERQRQYDSEVAKAKFLYGMLEPDEEQALRTGAISSREIQLRRQAKAESDKQLAEQKVATKETGVAREAMLGGEGGQGPLTPTQELQAQNFPQLAPGDKESFVNRLHPEQPKAEPLTQFDPNRQYTAAELGQMGLSARDAMMLHGKSGQDIQTRLGEGQPPEPVRPSYERGQAEAEARRRGLQPGTPEYYDFVTSGGKESVMTSGQEVTNRLEQIKAQANLVFDAKEKDVLRSVLSDNGWSEEDYRQGKDNIDKAANAIVASRRAQYHDQIEAKARQEIGDNDGSRESLKRALMRVVEELEIELRQIKDSYNVERRVSELKR